MAEPFIGEIKIVGFNFAPRGYALCDGQLLPISQNTALFSLLGTTYGGDGRTTFGLPDLRGRAAVHQGQGPGLSLRTIGERSGTESVTLSVAQIPNHSHAANCQSGPGDSNDPQGRFWSKDLGVSSATYHSAANANMNNNTIGAIGGSQSHDNMSPFLTVNFVIALVGVFPSRN